MNAYLKATLETYGATLLKAFTTCYQRAQVRNFHLQDYGEYFVVGTAPDVTPPKTAQGSARAYVAHLVEKTGKHGVRKATQSLMHWPKDGVIEASADTGFEMNGEPKALAHDDLAFYLEYRGLSYIRGQNVNIHSVVGITYLRGTPVMIAVYSRRKVGTALLQRAVRENIKALVADNR